MLEADQISGIAKHLQQAVTGIFTGSAVEGNTETHVGPGGWNIEIIEKRNQVRVSCAIVNDETGIYRNQAFFGFAIDCVGMSAKPIFCLNQRYSMALRQ